MDTIIAELFLEGLGKGLQAEQAVASMAVQTSASAGESHQTLQQKQQGQAAQHYCCCQPLRSQGRAALGNTPCP